VRAKVKKGLDIQHGALPDPVQGVYAAKQAPLQRGQAVYACFRPPD
jgi:hypothetical protein